MNRRLLALIIPAMMVMMSFSFVAPSAETTTQWDATATKAINLLNATKLEALTGTRQMNVEVALKLHHKNELQQYIQDINTSGNARYGQSLTPSEFTAKYGPTESEVNAVSDYLQKQGLTVTKVASNNLLISATGTAKQVESAFHTQISWFKQNGQKVFANTLSAQVPESLADTVNAVLGLNSVARMSTPLKVRSDASLLNTLSGLAAPNYPASYNPKEFWKAYDVGDTPTGSGTNIAIFAAGNLDPVVQNLRVEEEANGLTKVPVTIVQTGPASSDTSGAVEWDMDTQYSTGMAGNVSNLYLYDASSLSNADIAKTFNKFVSQNVAKAGSASFGECGVLAYATGLMSTSDQIFAEAAAQGQTVFASAGDTGGFCTVAPTNGVPAGIPDVEYPAASPYVTAVGGTTLFTNSDGSYSNEIAWLAGGGGPSYFESEPAWQQGVILPSTGKGVPDISMDADPNSGAEVYISPSSTETVGGTSLSSPLALGVWARLEASHNNQLGFASPVFYQAYQSNGFHDIILGDNGPYPALPGWDFATGLGTVDINQMDSAIGPAN